MILLPTAEIKKFISSSSVIADTRMLPVYGYIKLVCKKSGSHLIKHNGHKFLVYDIDAEFKKEQTLLIETKPFFGFVKYSRSPGIYIEPNGKTVTIKDDERTIKCQLTTDLYPSIEDHSKCEKWEIGEGVVASMSVAKTHLATPSDNVMRPWTCFVHIKKIEDKWYVIGTRGEVTYFNGFIEKLPEISLEPEVVSVLNSCNPKSYYSVENFDYFESIGQMYGFIKPETKCSDQVNLVLKNFKSNDSFEVESEKIADFCEMVNMVNDSSVPPVVKIVGNGESEIRLNFEDVSDNVKAETPVRVARKTFDLPECWFLPRNLLTVLKGADSKDVKISYAHKNFIITTSEPNYFGAVMELAPLK